MITGKVGGLSGKKAIALIFLVVGIMLMFFIISQGTSLYKSSRESTDRTGVPGVQCVGYFYTISEITATQDELQFTFRNERASTEDVRNITVAGLEGKKQSFDVNILPGQSLSLRVPATIVDNFSVYPASCSVFPARCNLAGECTYK